MNSSHARRPALRTLKPDATTHAGLWLDRFLAYQTDMPNAGDTSDDIVKSARATLMREVSETLRMPQGYSDIARTRLAAASQPLPGRRRLVRFYKTTSRVVIGLGQKTTAEAGIRLEHTWGVPFLPGSSLKGLTAAVAHQRTIDDAWRKGATSADVKGASHAELFGALSNSGRVLFHDAWWQPKHEADALPLAADVMTVHHPTYYQASSQNVRVAPDGTDSPKPIAFLSVPPEETFVVVLEASDADEDWLNAAAAMLDYGFNELGIGAKTNAGYGRLIIDQHAIDRWTSHNEEQREEAAFARQFSNSTLAQRLHLIFDRLAADAYDALRAFTPGATTLEELRASLVASSAIGATLFSQPYVQLGSPTPHELKDALSEALSRSKAWSDVLRHGRTPEGWQLSAGVKTRKELGKKLLGEDDVSPSVSESTPDAFSTDEARLLAGLRQRNGATDIDGVKAACDAATTSENRGWLKELAQELKKLNPKKKDKALAGHLGSLEADVRARLKMLEQP